MKRDRWIACPMAAILAFVLGLAGALCLPTGFELQADRAAILRSCILWACLCAVCFTCRLGAVPPLLLAAAAAWQLLWGELAQHVETMLYQISVQYDRAYGLGVLYWGENPPPAGDVTGALCLIGCLIAQVTAWTVCRQKPAAWTVSVAVLPLAACLVVTDRVPHTVCLILLLTGLTVLLLSQTVRRQHVGRGNALTALVSLPVLLAVILLFWAVPEDTYTGQERADRWLLQLESWMQELSGTAAAPEQAVSLAQTGQVVQLHTPVMTVKSDTGRVLYLRGQGFQMYDGTTWYNEHADNPYEWMENSVLEQAGSVEITTRSRHMQLFVPYYPAAGERLDFVPTHGMVGNTALRDHYGFQLRILPEDAPSAVIRQIDGAHLELPVGQHQPDALSLPADTVRWAEPLAQSLVAGKYTVQQRAEAIGDYVRAQALYSRATGRMPDGKRDFAQWFLQESETGYCVHFATASAVLLRAAGIHAQYVTGYMVETVAGRETVVYQDQAHAWVEYYDPACGWRVLESTPAEGLPVTQAPQLPETQGTAPTFPQASVTPTERPQPTVPETEQGIGPVLYGIIGALLLMLLIIVQWQVRVRLLSHRLETGTANQRAVAYWRETVRLCRLLKQRPKPELFTLAQKAKFSQHTLCQEELIQLEDALQQLRKQLKESPWYWQPVYTLLLAVY